MFELRNLSITFAKNALLLNSLNIKIRILWELLEVLLVD